MTDRQRKLVLEFDKIIHKHRAIRTPDGDLVNTGELIADLINALEDV